jgi:hypothetical protein
MSDRKSLRRVASALPAPALLTTLLLCGDATAQTNLYNKTGTAANDRLGVSVRLAGDVNMDGKPDFIAGAPENGNIFSPGEGYARVYSGANGSTIWTLNGLTADDAFGMSVDGAGDVNNDGRADVIVGAPNASGLKGKAYVLSGMTGGILFTFEGDLAGDQLGMTVAGIGDVDNDGRPDVLAGSPLAAGGGTARGMVRIYSGMNGSVLTTINGVANNNRFGASADLVGDVNGDGRPDFVVGSYFAGAKIYSGMTFGVLQTFTSASVDDRFGFAVAGCGDANGDGALDVIIGAPQDNNVFNPGTGFARIHSGSTGALIRTLFGGTAGDRFGCSVAGARDIDGDGKAEVIVGADQDTVGAMGYARVFRGSDGLSIFTFDGLANGARCGVSVDGLGDLEANGSFELIVGQPNRSVPLSLTGRVDVWSVTSGGCPVPYNYCAVTNNSTGQPCLISHTGSQSVSANTFGLRATGGPSNTAGLFFYGPTEVQAAFGNGFRCVGGVVWRLGIRPTNASGVATCPISFPTLPAAINAGSTWKFQYWYRNPAAGGANFNLSDGLSVTFCN